MSKSVKMVIVSVFASRATCLLCIPAALNKLFSLFSLLMLTIKDLVGQEMGQGGT